MTLDPWRQLVTGDTGDSSVRGLWSLLISIATDALLFPISAGTGGEADKIFEMKPIINNKLN